MRVKKAIGRVVKGAAASPGAPLSLAVLAGSYDRERDRVKNIVKEEKKCLTQRYILWYITIALLL
jgi:hypothetical protein